MLFTVNLLNAMEYRKDNPSLDSIEAMEAGSETVFCFRHGYDDVIFTLDLLWSGSREPWTAEEKALIDRGLPSPHREGYGLQIPAGRYRLLQCMPVADEKELRRIAMPFAGTRSTGTLYVRFLKENAFETVMQLLEEEP